MNNDTPRKTGRNWLRLVANRKQSRCHDPQAQTATAGHGTIRRELRPETMELWAAASWMAPPHPGVAEAFGLASPQHLERLTQAILHGAVSLVEIDRALGDGAAITALVDRCEGLPHPGLRFETMPQAMPRMDTGLAPRNRPGERHVEPER